MEAVPPVSLLDRVRDWIRVKDSGIHTEQAYFDWIRRFILFHGKRHSPGVEAYLTHLDRMFFDRSWPTSTDH